MIPIDDIVNRFKDQNLPVFYLTVFAKFLFGVGLGVLLTTHFQSPDWNLLGWSIVILSLILSIPAYYGVMIAGRRV